MSGPWTGNFCPDCGSDHMIRAGTCELCQDCGATTGCSRKGSMRALALVAVLALTGCGSLFGQPDPRYRRNLEFVQGAAPEAPDPIRAGQAISDAEGILADAEGREALANFVRDVVRAPLGAATGGIPWDTILGIVGTAGAAFTTLKTVRRVKAKSGKAAPPA